jgi:hypothetical protein
MDESERTVHAGAACGDVRIRRVCRQLVSDDVRYRFWLRRHEQPMSQVAASKYRREQIIHLRSTAVQHVHKTALVRYLSDFHITGKERDLTLAEFHGVTDPVQATIDEHHGYLLSASTGFCAEELLTMVDDSHGLDMIQSYRETYGQFFSLYCGHARAMRRGRSYLLAGLMPELRTKAAQTRERILAGQCMPRGVYGRHLRRAS